MTFAEKIKSLRKEKGLSQAELAIALNLGRSCLSMLEIGKNEPTASNLLLFAKFFNVSIDYLLGIDDDTSMNFLPHGVANGEQLTKEERKLLESYRQLDSYGKMRVETYADLRLEECKKNTPPKKA